MGIRESMLQFEYVHEFWLILNGVNWFSKQEIRGNYQLDANSTNLNHIKNKIQNRNGEEAVRNKTALFYTALVDIQAQIPDISEKYQLRREIASLRLKLSSFFDLNNSKDTKTGTEIIRKIFKIIRNDNNKIKLKDLYSSVKAEEFFEFLGLEIERDKNYTLKELINQEKPISGKYQKLFYQKPKRFEKFGCRCVKADVPSKNLSKNSLSDIEPPTKRQKTESETSKTEK